MTDYPDLVRIGTTDGMAANKHAQAANSGGLGLSEVNGSLDVANEFLLSGHSSAMNSLVSNDLSGGVRERWQRVWYLAKTGALDAKLSFDLGESGLGGARVDPPGNYRLLYRPATSGTFSVVTQGNSPVSAFLENGDQISFTLPNASLASGYYTLGITTPGITAAGSTLLCPGGSVTLSTATASGYSYQWLRNDVPLSGATMANYQATQTGAYRLVATFNGLSFTSDPIPVVVQQPTLSLTSSPASPGPGTRLLASGSAAGNALTFDGVDDFVDITPLPASVTNTFTIEAWVLPTVTHQLDAENASGLEGISGQRYLIYPSWPVVEEAGAGISVGTNGVSVYEHAYGYVSPLLVWSGNLTTWTHVAVVYTNKVPSLYINGQWVKTGLTGIKAIVRPCTTIGGGHFGYFRGSVDEVRIWSLARSAADLAADMNRTVASNASGLMGYWQFDEGYDNTIVDAATANNYGKLSRNGSWSGSWVGEVILPPPTATSASWLVPSSAPILPSYRWSPATGLSATEGAEVTANPTSPTTYTLSASTGSGCANITTVVVQPVDPVIPIALDPAASQDLNYVTTNTVLAEGKKSEAALANLTVRDLSQTTVYFDGLGRPLQSVTTQGSPGRKDIVEPLAYDAYGRQPAQYLPYTGGTDGKYKANALGANPLSLTSYRSGEQYAFHQNTPNLAHDTHPYAAVIFENSPLSTPLEAGGGGQHWNPTASGGAGKTTKATYRTHTDNEVRRWTLNPATGAIASPGFYATGARTPNPAEPWVTGPMTEGVLSVSETRDEENNRVLEYTDRLGRTVLKRAELAAGDYLDTYSVYDDFGNLRAVIPPQAVAEMQTAGNWAPDDAFLDRWCFQYRYDRRQRLTESRAPGVTHPTLTVYNRLDQPILSQDANQRGGAASGASSSTTPTDGPCSPASTPAPPTAPPCKRKPTRWPASLRTPTRTQPPNSTPPGSRTQFPRRPTRWRFWRPATTTITTWITTALRKPFMTGVSRASLLPPLPGRCPGPLTSRAPPGSPPWPACPPPRAPKCWARARNSGCKPPASTTTVTGPCRPRPTTTWAAGTCSPPSTASTAGW